MHTVPFKQVRIVINPVAGRREPVLFALNNVLQNYNVKWDASVTKEFGDGAQIARKAVFEGADLLIAYGGDGTIHDVLQGLVNTDLPLAILPGGTGNGIAAEINVLDDIESTLRQIMEGQGTLHPVDVGCLNDEVYYLLRADVSLAADIVLATDRATKNKFGILGYALNFARRFSVSKPVTFSIDAEGETIHETGVACLVANMGDLGTFGLHLGEDVRYDDGLLNLFLLKNDALSHLELIRYSLERMDLHEVVLHRKACQLRIETDPRAQSVTADGEVAPTTPLDITCLPGALQLFIPE